MSKWKLYFLYVITFGIAYFVINKKAKEQANKVNSELTISDNVPFKLNELYDCVGGKENINKTEANINSLKIYLKDISKTQQDAIKKLGAKGSMISEECVTCLFGDYSKTLHDLITKDLSEN